MNGNTATRRLRLAGGEIEYILTRRSGIKNINLRIKSDCSVRVSAPPTVGIEKIEAFMRSKESFIMNALAKYRAAAEQRAAEPKACTDGGTAQLLGRKYALSVRMGAGVKKSAALGGNVITVTAPDEDAAAALLEKLLRERLAEYIDRAVERYFPCVGALGAQRPLVRLRSMRSRWGSCIPSKGRVTFSTMLVPYPPREVDYVVLHELAHLIHPDHSKRFYALIEQYMPDWKQRRERLKKPPEII